MERMQIAVSWLLKIGVLVALLLVVAGGAIYLYQHGQDVMYYSVFRGEPVQATSISHILQAAFMLVPLGLIQLGILILVVTQVLRVALIAGFFAHMKDYKFTGISLFVLAALVGVSFGMV